MRILFTKYHEVVTSVKKSVTQVRLQASGRGFEAGESPVVDRVPPTTYSSRFSVQQKEAIPAFISAHTGEVIDTVDLHGPSKDNPSQVTYSMTGGLRGDPLRERYVGENALKSEERCARKQHRASNEQMGDAQWLLNE
jgi:hypothetical protein